MAAEGTFHDEGLGQFILPWRWNARGQVKGVNSTEAHRPALVL